LAFVPEPVDLHIRVQPAKTRFEPRPTAQHGIDPADDPGVRPPTPGREPRGPVAGADVFGQCRRDVPFDFRCQLQVFPICEDPVRPRIKVLYSRLCSVSAGVARFL